MLEITHSIESARQRVTTAPQRNAASVAQTTPHARASDDESVEASGLAPNPLWAITAGLGAFLVIVAALTAIG